jgi:MFS family permease
VGIPDVPGAVVLFQPSSSVFCEFNLIRKGQPTFQEYMNIVNAPATTGTMSSMFYVGGFFGALFNSWYVDRVGRKASIGTACIIMLISCALCAGSVHAAMFIVFRFTTGWR